MNEIPNYGNLNENNQNRNIADFLQKRNNISLAMDNLKHEVASELGYNHVKIPYGGGDMTSREIGIHAGPVGGVIVKDLIANAEQMLLEKYGKK